MLFVIKVLKKCLDGCLDLFLPERCVICNRQAGLEADLLAPGPLVAGLRIWDRPHLCHSCFDALQGESPCRFLRGGSEQCVVAAAGLVTEARVVKLVGALKYHGMRGVAWPLTSLAARAWQQVLPQEVDYLVALPLHPRRRRERGFNQAELLARLLAPKIGVEYLPGLLHRRRQTPQQARLNSCFAVRYANVCHAFQADSSVPPGVWRLGLVDDIITSGATILAAAAALSQAGWQVPLALAVGMSADPATERDGKGTETILDSTQA